MGQFTQEEGENSFAKGVHKKEIVFNLTKTLLALFTPVQPRSPPPPSLQFFT
jgi:hypothetical protein